jgi:hypothetical protein
MSRTRARMSCLARQKQLLVLESEVNRAQLAGDWERLKEQTGGLAHKVGALAAGALALAAISAVLRGARKGRQNANGRITRFLPGLINGARFGASLWLAHRARSRSR